MQLCEADTCCYHAAASAQVGLLRWHNGPDHNQDAQAGCGHIPAPMLRQQ